MRSRSAFSVWDDMFNLIDRVWVDFDKELMKLNVGATPNCLIEGDSFPPCNIRTDKDKNLHLEFAVAGYEEKEIGLSYEKDYLTVTVNPEKKEDEEFKYIRRGIKRGKASTKVWVPASLYDQASIKASIKNGILTVAINALPEAKPVSIPILSQGALPEST